MTTDYPQWTRSGPAGITGRWHTRALGYDPGLSSVVLFTQGAGVCQRDVWRWTGSAFAHVVGDIFPERHYSDGIHGLFLCHDPVTGETLLFGQLGTRPDPEARASLTGVVMTPLSRPDEERVLSYPPELADDRRLLAAFRFGGRLLVLAHDGSVLAVPDDGDSLLTVAGPIPDLDEEKHALRTAVADPDRGVVVASSDDYDGRMFVWHPDGGWADGPATGEEGNSLVWNPVARRVDVLCGKAPQTLRPYDQPDAGGPQLSFFTRAAPLAYDAADGAWVLVGRDNDAYVARDTTVDGDGFVAASAMRSRLPFADADGWLTTATTDGPLWAAKLGYSGMERLDGDHWVSVSHDIDDPELVAASPRGLVVLDEDGALHRIGPNGRSVRLSRPEEDVEGRSHEYNGDRLCWDEAGDRLVLWSGENLETFVRHSGRWRELVCDEEPPEGEALLCANPVGVYCLVGGELWLLRGDAWTQVGEDTEWDARSLFWSRRHGGLWSVSNEGVGVWRDGRFQVVAELSPGCALAERKPGTIVLFDTSGKVVYDPVGDVLISDGGGGCWRLPLADCVPTGDLDLPGLAVADALPVAPTGKVGPSGYVLECSGSSVWRTVQMVYTFPTADEVRREAETIGCAPRGSDATDLGLALEFVSTSFVWRVWTVQQGVLAHGVDLLPYFVVHCGDGRSLRAAPEQREAIWDSEGDVVAISLDWDGVVAALPALQGAAIAQGEVFELRIDTHPAPDVDSCLADGMALRFGGMDDDDPDD